VAGEANEIHFLFAQNGGDLAIVGFTLEALGRNHAGINAARAGAFDAGRVFAMADDHGNFGVGDAAGGDALREGFEIRAAS